MRSRFRYVFLFLTLSLAPAKAQVHRPEIANGTNPDKPSLDTLPYIKLADIATLRIQIKPKSPEADRAKRYDFPGEPLFNAQDPQRHTFVSSSVHRRITPFPVTGSDVIVIGTITSEAAHISQSGTNIYSTFQLSPTAVLKGALRGSSIELERSGGVGLYPSGEKMLLGAEGMGIPEQNYKYVFFLKSVGTNGSFFILTGYLLNSDKVVALDKIGDSLTGITPDELIRQVQKSISLSK